MLLHFALKCTISGWGAKVRPNFSKCWSGLERWITYRKESKSVAKDLIWSRAQKEKCETWGKRGSHWGNPLLLVKPGSMKGAVLLNWLLDKGCLWLGSHSSSSLVTPDRGRREVFEMLSHYSSLSVFRLTY